MPSTRAPETFKRTLKRTLLITAAVIGALSFGTVAYLALSGDLELFLKGGDDEPIIMAGGSIVIATPNSGTWLPDANKPKHLGHKNKKNFIGRIDILAATTKGGEAVFEIKDKLIKQKVEVTARYCPDKDCTPPVQDTVKLLTNSSGHFDDSGDPIVGLNSDEGWAKEINGNVIHHKLPPPQSGPAGTIQQIDIAIGGGTPQTYFCPDGKCVLIVHYCKKCKSL